MAPVIPSGAILCVDTAVTDRNQLDQKIAEGVKIANDDETGLGSAL